MFLSDCVAHSANLECVLDADEITHRFLDIRTYCHAGCEMVSHGIHGRHRKTSTYLRVSTRKNVSRKGAKGAKRYVLLFLCQKYCTQITQNHADALRNFAPLREKKICPFVLMSKKIFHTELTEYTEFLLRNSIYFFCQQIKQHRMTQNFVFDRSIELVPQK